MVGERGREGGKGREEKGEREVSRGKGEEGDRYVMGEGGMGEIEG